MHSSRTRTSRSLQDGDPPPETETPLYKDLTGRDPPGQRAPLDREPPWTENPP